MQTSSSFYSVNTSEKFVCRYANSVHALHTINLLSSLIDLVKMLQDFCNMPSVLCVSSG